MKNVILCSSNPILTKNLYCVLREEGYTVETVEHPSHAVQKVLNGNYDFVVVDSEPFGLSAEDAAEIIGTIAPNLPILYVGSGLATEHTQAVKAPLDLEEFKRTIHRFTF